MRKLRYQRPFAFEVAHFRTYDTNRGDMCTRFTRESEISRSAPTEISEKNNYIFIPEQGKKNKSFIELRKQR